MIGLGFGYDKNNKVETSGAPTDNWILASGNWNDSGKWKDSSSWID